MGFSPKYYIIKIVFLLLCGCSSYPYTNKSIDEGASPASHLSSDTLRIFCSEDQHQLTCQWINDFQKDHHGIHAEVLLYNKSLPPGKLSSEKEGLFLVGEPNIKKISENYWCIKYARDGIVFIFNEANPSYKEIMEYGFGIQPFTLLETGKDTRRWSKLSGSEQTRPVKVFVCSDSLSTCKLLVDYLKIDPDESKIVITEKVQDIIDSVRLDPLSMRLCCQRYAYDLITRTKIPASKIIPFDCNGNGILEKKEKFYNNLDELRRAMLSGKYPCHSFLNYYIVAAAEPTNKLHIDFIKWVMTEGQLQLESEGYVLHRTKIINKEIEKINDLTPEHAFTLLY